MCLESEFSLKCVSIQWVQRWSGGQYIRVLVIPLVLMWYVICSKTVLSQYPFFFLFYPILFVCRLWKSTGIEILSLAKCLALSCLWSISNMIMEATDISSGPNSISDGNLNLFRFFASRRRVSRWQYFPFSDHCHFLLFSQCGIDFISCFAVLPTQGQLMVSFLSLLPPYLSRNRAVSLLVRRKKGWWSASVIASVFPDLSSLMHKWNRDRPLRYTISIHTQQCRGEVMESEFLPVGHEIKLDSQW